ncbi:MAG: ABC transporter substrate-binding protein [Chloroflexi bacterium]|nr:ABC transporter substrate-binding protein [Chloroflexota bacterium]
MKNLGKLKVVSSLALVALLLLAGCGKAQPTTTAATTTRATTTAAATTQTPTGPYGELRIGTSTFDEETFDPIRTATTNSLQFLAPMMDWLVRLDGAKLVPGLAESWEAAPDGLSWTFRIRKGIKFHNGEALTADDVKFSIERYRLPDAHFSELRSAVDRVEVVDDSTVRIFTKTTQPYFPYFFSFFAPGYGVVSPKDYIESKGIANFVENPIGSGPWKFIRHASGDMVEWEAVNNHWRQTPAFKKLSVVLIPEEATRIAAMKTGLIDVTDISLEGARDLEKVGFNVQRITTQQNMVLLDGAFDPATIKEKLPISDVKVRQALSLALNRSEINQSFLYGKGGPPLPGYLAQEVAGDADIPYWEDQSAKVYARFDTTEAKRLLTEAGYPQGFKIKLWAQAMGGAAYLPKLAEVVAGYWEKIGVKVELVPSDWGQVRSIANVNQVPNSPLRGNSLMMRMNARPTITATYNSHVVPDGTIGILGRAFPEVEGLVKNIATEVSEKKRQEMVAKLVKIVADQYVSLPLPEAPSMAALGPKVQFQFKVPTQMPAQYADLMKHK